MINNDINHKNKVFINDSVGINDIQPELEISYYDSHKNEILLQKKDYYKKNKNKLLKKVECSCGSVTAYAAYTRHLKSKKHLKFVDNTELEPISEELTSE